MMKKYKVYGAGTTSYQGRVIEAESKDEAEQVYYELWEKDGLRIDESCLDTVEAEEYQD